jgi:hypothetical protein
MRARKGDSLLYGAISALGKWLLVSPYPLMRSLGILWALQSGRTGRAPPRESPFGHPGSYPVRQSLFGELPAWRGGLRTPASETSLSPGDRPIRPPGVPLPRMIMLCTGLRPAVLCGRGDRAPPRKPPPRHLRPSPARPSVLG